jgi:hypothetical protein
VKEHLAELVRAARAGQGRNVAREYLQARILESLQRSGAMLPLAFHGGTALRFLYGLPRYSEDLDFALERPGASYDLPTYLTDIRTALDAEGYRIEAKVSTDRVVHSAWVRLPGLLYELGLSAQRDEVLAVKIEVDTRPPAGAGLATTLVRRHVLLRLQHHDQPTLLAGKLHALLQRPYAKGRDIYDLVWYLSTPGWPPPNLMLLNNALAQTGRQGDTLTEANWREVVRARLLELPWERVAPDVAPFLERQDAVLPEREEVLRLLAS